MSLLRPPRRARRLAAIHNGDRVSRAEIAWAVPAGSRRARSQSQFLAAAVRCAELDAYREDRRRNLLEVARILARYASWDDRTTRPTRAVVCKLAGIKLSTWKVCRALWEKWGFLGTVRQGRTSMARPAALDDGRNEAAVYVLAVPIEKRSKPTTPAPVTPVTRPPTELRSSSCTTHTRARRETPERRTALRADSPAKPALPPALRKGAVLEKLSEQARAHFWRPFAAAAWTPADFLHAVNHLPSGRQHRRDLHDVIYPAGWLRYRLAPWLDAAGVPVPSRSQRWAAAAAAARAEQARRRGLLEGQAAAAAGPNADWRAAREQLLARSRRLA